MQIRRLLGKRAREFWGKNRKKEIRHKEDSEWRREYDDEQLYPELEDDEA
jgi:hypothetical protein